VRASLERHAEQAPTGANLLDAVHARSRRLTRRRRLGAVAAGALALAALAGAVALPARTHTPPSDPLVAPTFTAPLFPFTPTVTPVGGLEPPEVTLVDGELSAYWYAKDPVAGTDIEIRVGPRPPVFTGEHDNVGPVHQTPQRVRGHAANLRTVVVKPANRLSLYWLEAPGEWVRLDTDDTLTDAQVVRLADALAPAALPVVRPFRFDVVPPGARLSTSTRSTMALGPVTCTLVHRKPLSGKQIRVGSHWASLDRTVGGATLTVALDNANLVVSARYPVTDADLVRFAAGIHVTDAAEPQ
jgi:hypothetical protein